MGRNLKFTGRTALDSNGYEVTFSDGNSDYIAYKGVPFSVHINSKFSSSWYGNDNVVPKSYEDMLTRLES